MKKIKKVNEGSVILLICLTLCLIGALEIYSASSLKSMELYGNGSNFFIKQMFGILVGFFIVFLIGKIPQGLLDKVPLYLTILSFILLLFVFSDFSTKVKGATRWIRFSFITLQPSEIAKIAIILFFAKHMGRKTFNPNDILKSLLPSLLVLGVFAFLLMKQPDFGTVFLTILIVSSMLFVSNLDKKIILLGIFFIALFAFIAIYSSPYRLQRVMSFTDPWSHMQKGGFQIIQSYVGFQSGGFFGLGLGGSKQKLFFLPEAHTDFILAVIGEELGLLGTIFILILFTLLIYYCFLVSLSQKDPQKKLTCFGLSCLIAYQSLFNIAVVFGVLPTKGISLPFLSYGVSSLVSFFFAIGIITRHARNF